MDRLKEAGAAIAVRILREAEAEVRITRVRRFNAQQALLNLGLPISLRTSTNLSDTELAERLHFLGLPPEVVASLDAETASANLIPLISPFDGMIIDRHIVTGEVVDPNDVQFTIADVRRMWLIMSVRKEDAANLQVGQSVFFSSTGVPGEIERAVVTDLGTTMEQLSQAGAECGFRGERRALRVALNELEWELKGSDLTLSFWLQPGSYATSVLREVIKTGP